MPYEIPMQACYPPPRSQWVVYRPARTLRDLLCDCVEALAPVVAFGATVWGAYQFGSALLDLASPAPAPPRYRPVNDAPLEEWKKDYVSERDNWRCVYCNRPVTSATRHIDHRISRLNGGTNHLNNLSLACASCNLANGALNARQFR